MAECVANENKGFPFVEGRVLGRPLSSIWLQNGRFTIQMRMRECFFNISLTHMSERRLRDYAS